MSLKIHSPQSSEEESRDELLKASIRSEGEMSVGSSPISLSPSSTPRADEFAESRLVLSAASSTNDLTTVAEEEEEEDEEEEQEQEGPGSGMLSETPVKMDAEPVRLNAAVVSGDVNALGQSLTTRLTEISSAHSSDANSPSPCPSTTGESGATAVAGFFRARLG